MRRSLEQIREFRELGDYFDEPVKTTSPRMLTRSGFTTAVLNNASVLLIDKVFSLVLIVFRGKCKSLETPNLRHASKHDCHPQRHPNYKSMQHRAVANRRVSGIARGP